MANPTGLSAIRLPEAMSPATPVAGQRLLYPKSDGWYEKNSAGNETKIGPGSSDTLEWIDLALTSNFTPPVSPTYGVAIFNTKKAGTGLTVSVGGVVTVNKAGVYNVQFSAVQTNAVTGYVAWILYQRRAGSVIQQRETVSYGAGFWDAASITGIFDCLVGDTFELWASAQTASTSIEASRSQFTVQRLSGGSGGLTVVPRTSTYTAVDSDVVLANGTFTVTLPPAVSGAQVIVKNTGTGVITVSRAGSAFIDGATTAVVSRQYTAITVVSDGTNWFII